MLYPASCNLLRLITDSVSRFCVAPTTMRRELMGAEAARKCTRPKSAVKCETKSRERDKPGCCFCVIEIGGCESSRDSQQPIASVAKPQGVADLACTTPRSRGSSARRSRKVDGQDPVSAACVEDGGAEAPRCCWSSWEPKQRCNAQDRDRRFSAGHSCDIAPASSKSAAARAQGSQSSQ